MKKMLSLLSTMSIAVIPVMNVVACDDPDSSKFNLNILNDQNHSIYALLALPIYEEGYGFYPSEWDPINGTLKDEEMYSWMFDGSAESYVTTVAVSIIALSYEGITSDDIKVDWNYDTTAGIYKETITPSDTENAQNLLTGSCEFYINNFAPIDLSKLGDNGVITIPGTGIFKPNELPTTGTDLGIHTANRISAAIYNYFTDEEFFNNNNLSMYNGYFGTDNLSQDPKGYYFASSFSDEDGNGWYSYDDMDNSLITIPVALTSAELSNNPWIVDVANKTITFTIEAKHSAEDPTVIGSCTFTIDYSDVQ
ncbi:hypothetical protein [Spiroplasma endosymbiont of Amphibalanus improvisus]|uniref:hypothetical protein n=1 Tax=Spiroplasma endosymbiont of Amphibalanus improvisus TaxID=3066327 RepID=UPI00313D4E81